MSKRHININRPNSCKTFAINVRVIFRITIRLRCMIQLALNECLWAIHLRRRLSGTKPELMRITAVVRVSNSNLPCGRRQKRHYRAPGKSMFFLLSRTQTGPGRTVKQEQEEISRNHVQTLSGCSVRLNSFFMGYMGD